MSNMAYCRFQNTKDDLRECYDWLGEHNPRELSEDEQKAFKRLVKLCRAIVDDYEDYL
jgi:hypothetical protein